MHDSVKLRLEEYLERGAPLPEMEEHLRQCDLCRKEVEAMRMQAQLFRGLKAQAEMEPGAGFYARVMNRIESQDRPSVWSLFGDSMFARRLVYASALFLVLLGSYAVSSGPVEDEFAAASAPEVILAGRELPTPVSMDSPRDREVVLVTLATWGDSAEGDSQDWQ